MKMPDVPPLCLSRDCQAHAPHRVVGPVRLESDVDVDAAVARRLRPPDKTDLAEKFMHRVGYVDDRVETVLVGRVKVDAEFIGMIEVRRSGIPWMEVETVHLGEPHHILNLEREEHAPRPSRGKDDVDGRTCGTRNAFHVERLAANALCPSFEHRRAIVNAAKRALSTHDEVLRHIQLRPSLVRKDDLVGTRYAYRRTVRIHKCLSTHPWIMPHGIPRTDGPPN